MRRIFCLFVAISLVLGFSVSGCKQRESNTGKQIKRTMDRAQDAVDKVNQRQKDSIPDEDE